MSDFSRNITAKVESHLADCPTRTYAAGQIILFAHEDPECVYYVMSGKVRLYDVSPKGNEVVVMVYEPGRFFPLSWALNGTSNRYFFKAESPTTLRLVPAKKAVDLIANNPDITIDLLKLIYRKTDILFERMVYLMSATAARRLMYAITLECNQFGQQQSDGSCLVQVREVDLAGRTGLSRETVSREFQKLKEQGFVRLDKDGLRVLDMEKLEEQVGAIP